MPCGSDSDEQEVKSMEIVIRVPGSCGELIQGVLSDGPFLITCPIDCYVAVRISDRFTGWYGMGSKAKSAMKRTLVLLGEKEFPWGIRLESELPQGKGMSSSSADIAATAVGVAQALGYELSAADILREAVAIEPTDGIFCEGIVRMNSMTGTLLAQYPVLPSVRLSVFDTGGQIDTLAFHARPEPNFPDPQRIAEALAVFERGCRAQDAALIAQAATISALANQSVLYKAHLEELLDFVQPLGALGVNVAHSGTVIGVIWPAGISESYLEKTVRKICLRFPDLALLRQARLISGGVDIRSDTLPPLFETS